MTRTDFINRLKDKILVLDGAMGTRLIASGLAPGEAPENMNKERPDDILAIHRSFIEAGSDIILTNTFGGSSIKLSEFGLGDKAELLNKKGVEIALKAADGGVIVGGSIGPSGRYLPPIGSLDFVTAVDSFREQAKALTDAGVDIIVVETISDIRELRACLIGIREVFDGPLVAHMTYSDGFNTITGTDPETSVTVMEALDVDVIGVNCSTGPEEMEPVVRSLAEHTERPISVQPNAGIPEMRDGHACYPASPEELASYTRIFAEIGANIVGGCCGSGAEHVRAMCEAVKGMKPLKRTVPKKSRLASRDMTLIIDRDSPTRLLGERINPTGRKKFADELITGNFTIVRQEAKKQVQAGASIIDVNMGVPGQDEVSLMRKAVQAVQATVNVPLSLDSANVEALEAGLQEIEGKPIINSVTAEKEKLDTVIPLAKKYGAALIGLPLDERGIPATAEERFKLGELILNRVLEAGIPREDLYLDGLTMALSADTFAPEITLRTIEMFKQKLGVHTVLGVSNVSFGLPGRKDINAAFLTMALQKGLDLPIVNPYSEPIVNAVLTSDLLLGKDVNAKNYISRTGIMGEEKAAKPAPIQKRPIEEQIFDAILFGNSDSITSLIKKALKAGFEPMKINDDMLLPAMLEVGRRYDRKKFFLPQVIMAAETMHTAFAELKPHLPSAEAASKGTVILATVRGDVHDIGKNIVAALVENHGYTVIDMGKNVSTIELINKAEAVKADVIGLSALMTTTMTVMKETVAELKSSVSSKIIVGGAVVSRKFAEEIGADGYGKDAGEAVNEIKKILNSK